MKPYLVTMEIQEFLERQWCGCAGIFWDVEVDVDELAPVVAKPTEQVNDQKPVYVSPERVLYDPNLNSEDYYGHFVRAQERVAKSVNALLDVAPQWSNEIQEAVFKELEPLLNLAGLVDMKAR